MSEYTSTVLENQVSFFDDSDNIQDIQDTQEASDQHSENAVDQTAETTDTATDFKPGDGSSLVFPNWNKGFIQTQFPGIKQISRVNLKTNQREMFNTLEIPGTLDASCLPDVCPCCGAVLHKHGKRTVRINDVPHGNTRTALLVERDRYICSSETCRYTVTPELPFAMENHKVTLTLEAYIRSMLSRGMIAKEISMNTGVSPHIVTEIDKARLSEIYLDEDGKLKRPEKYARYLGVDEFLLHEGYHFATIFLNVETGEVLYVTDGKKKAGIDKFMDFVGDEWMQHVEAVACDMNADFADAFKARYPKIDIVFDYFHIVKNFNDHVMAEIRKTEQARLLDEGDKDAAKALKGSRHILNSNLDTLERRDQEGKDGKVANKGSAVFGIPESKCKESHREDRLWTILEKNELLLRAYVIKELLRAAYACTTPEAMEKYLLEILILCNESDNKQMKWFQKLIGRHWDGLINHAVYGISSGIVEGTNRKIKTIRWRSYGFPDDEYFFLKIMDATRN